MKNEFKHNFIIKSNCINNKATMNNNKATMNNNKATMNTHKINRNRRNMLQQIIDVFPKVDLSYEKII